MQIISVIDSIRQLKPQLSLLFGIKELAVFGSYARGEEHGMSDVDIAILDMERKNGFLVAKAKNFLSEQLDKEIDIGLYSAMNPFIQKSIENEMIHV
ncbi:MAG: uncharacterized protein QG558_332 [Campylobacterota bacterium]|nr:uncharacterized protein [Campylobacterota bacterium]